MNNIIKNELLEARTVLDNFINDTSNINLIEQAGNVMVEALQKGNKLLSCGNGGSMCDAMHFAEELTGRYQNTRKPLAAIAISDPAHISCVANDFGYDEIFSRFITAIGSQGDILLAISTSGNSVNVIKAVAAAKEKNMLVIGLTGNDGGSLKPLCDVCITVNHEGFSDRIQELHIKIIHILIHFIESKAYIC